MPDSSASAMGIMPRIVAKEGIQTGRKRTRHAVATASSIGLLSFLFFFNDTATTEIYTLSLHDALPISVGHSRIRKVGPHRRRPIHRFLDRKSTRLNSSHLVISYAVFCLKKQNKEEKTTTDSVSVVASSSGVGGGATP